MIYWKMVISASFSRRCAGSHPIGPIFFVSNAMEKFGYAGFRLFVFENGGVSHEGSCTGNVGKNQRLMQQRIAGWVSWFHPFQVQYGVGFSRSVFL